jgi:hypothetical protein
MSDNDSDEFCPQAMAAHGRFDYHIRKMSPERVIR